MLNNCFELFTKILTGALNKALILIRKSLSPEKFVKISLIFLELV